MNDVGAKRSIAERKVTRLRSGQSPRVLDLFAGCGGFSLGFHRAGCKIVGGVELDRHAAMSHAVNFHGHLRLRNPELFAAHCEPRDITATEPLDLMHQLGFTVPDEAVDILVGGPPCPTFTRVGRAKLREIHDHPEAFKHDPRSQLYLPYLGFVDALSPAIIVMENVPDLLNFGGHNLAEEIAEVLEDGGYRVAYTLLNAANYGVPEMRERFILLGLHEAFDVDPATAFPRPTNRVRFPPGYVGARDVALKTLRRQLALQPDYRSRWTDTPELRPDEQAPGPVTAREAIDDLPSILGHLTGEIKKGRRDLSDTGAMDYPKGVNASQYVQQHMWGWPMFESGPKEDRIRAHVIRSLSNRDYRLFAQMKDGWQYPEAYRLALTLFQEKLEAVRSLGGVVPDTTLHARRLTVRTTELLRQLAQPDESILSRLAVGWLSLESSAAGLQDAKLRFQASLHQVREGERFPDEYVVEPDVLNRWKAIADILDSLQSGSEPIGLEAVAPKATVNYRRISRAYARALRELDVSGADVEPLDAWTDAPFSRFRAAAAANVDAWSVGVVRPLNLLLDRLRWAVIGFVQSCGDFLWLKHQYVPTYDPAKFPNKWRKMEPDAPARTLMAHLGKDSYSHIHYDSEQSRTISVREAARLQSFPDGFRFSGSMNPGFRQIGNAVPPLFAFAIASSVRAAACTDSAVMDQEV